MITYYIFKRTRLKVLFLLLNHIFQNKDIERIFRGCKIKKKLKNIKPQSNIQYS